MAVFVWVVMFEERGSGTASLYCTRLLCSTAEGGGVWGWMYEHKWLKTTLHEEHWEEENVNRSLHIWVVLPPPPLCRAITCCCWGSYPDLCGFEFAHFFTAQFPSKHRHNSYCLNWSMSKGTIAFRCVTGDLWTLLPVCFHVSTTDEHVCGAVTKTPLPSAHMQIWSTTSLTCRPSICEISLFAVGECLKYRKGACIHWRPDSLRWVLRGNAQFYIS